VPSFFPWRVDVGPFNTHISEVPAAKPPWSRPGLAVPDGLHGLGKSRVRTDHLDFKRVDPEPFLFQLPDYGVYAAVRGPRRSVLAHQRCDKIEVPPAALALLDPGGGRHGDTRARHSVEKMLPILNLQIYQCRLIHENIPCFLSAMAS